MGVLEVLGVLAQVPVPRSAPRLAGTRPAPAPRNWISAFKLSTLQPFTLHSSLIALHYSYHAIVTAAFAVYQNAVPAGTMALPSQVEGRYSGPHFPLK